MSEYQICHYCFGEPLVNEGYAECPYCDGTGFEEVEEVEESEDEKGHERQF